MRRLLLLGLAIVGGQALFTRAASAQTAGGSATGFQVNRFEPSERGSDWFALESLDFRGQFRPAIGIIGDYSRRDLAIYNANDDPAESPVLDRLDAHLGASLNMFDRLRLAASMPIVAYTDGHRGVFNNQVYNSPSDKTTIGDLRLAADVRLFGQYGDPAQLALGVQAWIPTGNRDSYASDKQFRFQPHAILAGDVSILAYSVKAGFTYRNYDSTFGTAPIGSEVNFGAALGVRVLDKHLLIGPEFFGTSTTAGGEFLKTRTTPLEGLVGAHYNTGDFRIGAGAGKGLTRGYGSPDYRLLFGVEWMPAFDEDKDGDGIKDSVDACPTVPGQASTDPKKNGCPDRDHDGIFDSDDACPDVAGVASDDPKTNGCPDRDHDSVIDSLDACVDVPGIKTNDPKTNGCPDRDGDTIFDQDDACPDVPGIHTDDPKTNGCPDKDGDGVMDKDDACPDVPGLKTNDPKTNGCPDSDRDKDGIPNDVDACPDTPGKPNPDPKKNGCPVAEIKEGQIRILDQVKFKTNSAEIEKGKDSEDILEAVTAILRDHPEIEQVRVEGHTDNVGAAAYNKTLSGNRAGSVVKWLVAHGIDKKRLTSQGFGMERPIAENTSDEGRRTNRRVEFHIADLGGKTVNDKTPPKDKTGNADPTKPDAKPAAKPAPKK